MRKEEASSGVVKCKPLELCPSDQFTKVGLKVYNKTHIRWTTHKPPSLSMKDIQMSKFCDEKAPLFGEQDVPAAEKK